MEYSKVTEIRAKKEVTEQNVQENIANWQSSNFPLTTLSENQLDVIYQMKDLIEEQCYWSSKCDAVNSLNSTVSADTNTLNLPVISTTQDYILWMIRAENEMKSENLSEYVSFNKKQSEQASKCEFLFTDINKTVKAIEQLHAEYQQVTSKTDSLHNLSERLLNHQNELKNKRNVIKERLHYFRLYHSLAESINGFDNNITPDVFMNVMDKIDDCIDYLNDHSNFKETKNYIAKFENLLSKSMILIRKYFNDVIGNAMKQVTNPSNKTNLLVSNETENENENVNEESSFSLYYGKFLSAAVRVKPIISHIETKIEKRECYQQLLSDCQQIYFTHRSPIMTDAVTKALLELKNKYRNDHSILFRSVGLFIMQVCQDESSCFKYFFTQQSQQLEEYFGILCQNMYDLLRPCLIGIYHLEVLTELCGILRGEMLTNQIHSNTTLDKFIEITQQLLQDVEERLVFRTNIFFQNDLLGYKPSPGDLAYPEKLEQMEQVAEDISEFRAESRASLVSRDSQDVDTVNSSSHITPFRSYTGNSPADLHGMWYPTVKRTLVCLSRLYFCLDGEIFQGLAHEALSICVETIVNASNQICERKSVVDGQLFQIKHLLILREQIAPFQVDFTVKSISLDFSNIKAAAVGLIQNSDKLFAFSSNNALLEFLLEGTPKVKEYLIDSRKEIDKQLKTSCELLISNITSLLVGNLIYWNQKVENFYNVSKCENKDEVFGKLEFTKPQMLCNIITNARRNIKSKIPEVQKSLQLYLANKETEFILFRPIKNNVIKAFIQVEQVINTKYNYEEQLIIGCPTPEQINILICSVSLIAEQDRQFGRSSSRTSVSENPPKRDNKLSDSDIKPEADKEDISK